MNTDNTRIKTIIAALLAKAESTNSDAEAEAFFAKASELMEKYQIELHELGHQDPVGMSLGVDAQPGPPSYKSDVQCALAKFYGAKTILKGRVGGHWTVHIVGLESARLTTLEMFPFIWRQVGQAAQRLSDQTGYNKQKCIREVSKALCARIYRLVRDKEATPVVEGTSRSLVVVNAVAAFVDENYPDLRKSKPRPVNVLNAARQAAAGISINNQVGKSSPLRLK